MDWAGSLTINNKMRSKQIEENKQKSLYNSINLIQIKAVYFANLPSSKMFGSGNKTIVKLIRQICPNLFSGI